MASQDRKPRTFMSAAAFVFCANAAFAVPAAAATDRDTALLRWGITAMNAIDPSGTPAKTDANDDFASAHYTKAHNVRPTLAADGRVLETAGKGSSWVYDPAHHVVAYASTGDVTGSSIFRYTIAPPGTLPTRNLATIVTARGIRLGMTSAQVISLLRIAPGSLHRTSSTETEIYARQSFSCSSSTCAHDESFVFRNDRAVAIELVDLGP